MLVLSVGIAIASAISGYWVSATILEKSVSISGTIASMTGVFFLVALVFAPQRRRRQRFAVEMLLVHLSSHEGSKDAALENSVSHLTEELRWQPSFAAAAVRRATGQVWIERANGHLQLTPDGRHIAQQVVERAHA